MHPLRHRRAGGLLRRFAPRNDSVSTVIASASRAISPRGGGLFSRGRYVTANRFTDVFFLKILNRFCGNPFAKANETINEKTVSSISVSISIGASKGLAMTHQIITKPNKFGGWDILATIALNSFFIAKVNKISNAKLSGVGRQRKKLPSNPADVPSLSPHAEERVSQFNL